MWFVKELAKAGHTITAIFPRALNEYQELRRERVDRVLKFCEPVFSCPFGKESFVNLLRSEPRWDLLCHHAADVHNYKSPDFDFAHALANNTANLKEVLTLLKERGCHRVLLTGSVFEQNEGKGSDGLRAVSPYGLSKGLTSDVFQFFTSILEMKLGKFVIPNPFGPYEEPRFTSFLAKSWFEGKTPNVAYPDYVRDNIHVSLLAKAYASFAEQLTDTPGYKKINPKGYDENQGNFTKRFALEMEKRLSIPCKVELGNQVEFSEPKVRVNTDPLNIQQLHWDENQAWDELAEYYQKRYG